MDESGNKKKHGQPYKIVGKLAVELVTVIAGILIALFVNSIQEKRADKKNLDETLHALSLEFDKNRDTLKVYLIDFKDSGTYWNFMKRMLP